VVIDLERLDTAALPHTIDVITEPVVATHAL